jgi:hypothetical protein
VVSPHGVAIFSIAGLDFYAARMFFDLGLPENDGKLDLAEILHQSQPPALKWK